MSGPSAVYSFDTSALIDGLERYYPVENFPAMWDRVDALINAGRLLISEEVWEEVAAKTNATKEWCGARLDRMVVPTDGIVTTRVSAILTAHPKLVANMKGRNRADAFVIAVAQIRGATVVTGEGADGTPNKPKIPFICTDMGLPCTRLLGVVQAEGWRFD
jgi:hypothetical protein